MTTATKEMPTEIPTRDQMDEKHCWDLTDLFRSEDDWEASYKSALELVDQGAAFAGKLTESAATLYKCLRARSELGKIAFSLYQYAHLSKDINNRSSKYQAMTDKAAMLSSQAATAYSFVEPELLKAGDEQLLKLAGQFEKTDEYDFYIKELIRSREHIRSEEVEELLAASSVVARGPESFFSMLDDADIVYPSIKDEEGNEIQLTKQRFAKFMESSDRRVRAEASNAFYTPYKNHLNTLGASLAGSVNKDIFYFRARRFDSCLHASLDSDNIPVSVYEGLLENTTSNLSRLHRYVNLRRKILKLDKIHLYDMVCPLFPERNYEVKYDQAVEEISQALEPLGREYCHKLKEAFECRWVDVYETAGKSGGAFSWGNFTAHPFVMMNFNETIDSMFTLAHEMGHALHSHMSNKSQPYPKSQYSIFVAEVASTLNEGLLLQQLLKKASDKLDRLYLLNRQIDNTLGTFLNQIMYAGFELQIHRVVEQGNALSPDMMTEMWTKATRKFYGDGLTLDDLTILKWCRIPHFYSAFYVYQYATSYAASQAILTKFIEGDETLIERYLELLSAGGNDYPIELLKKCGVDMSTPDPINATLSLFEQQVDEMEDLID